MMRYLRLATAIAVLAGVACEVSAQEDVADVPAVDLRAGEDPDKRYFLIGEAADRTPPEAGYGLVIVLPGGDGSADFHPFVKRIFKHAVPEGYLVAQPVAVQWTDRQIIVWPTAKAKVPKARFTTEELIAAVIDDVGRTRKLDPQRVFVLGWSSGGPAAYAAAISETRIRGAFVAMSVFKPSQLPPLQAASDRGFYLYHSPEDRVCPFRMAELARTALENAGARVTVKTYDGGHGWRGDLYTDIRDGIEWLEKTGGVSAVVEGTDRR